MSSPRVLADDHQLVEKGVRLSFERRGESLQLLTSRERRVLREISTGKTTDEIARDLSITRKTFYSHRANIRKKLQLSTDAALANFAASHAGLWEET